MRFVQQKGLWGIIVSILDMLVSLNPVKGAWYTIASVVKVEKGVLNLFREESGFWVVRVSHHSCSLLIGKGAEETEECCRWWCGNICDDKKVGDGADRERGVVDSMGGPCHCSGLRNGEGAWRKAGDGKAVESIRCVGSSSVK
ncbi:uncharacterized protein GGS22DRAFT_75016 [Annulohypoxylon maeteangense]|uniref:uncharacterized protein n=1 Tax=Annulohypoxylon maeteangense TaxID=1927788 RepID=UPI0020086353|nr:uncharacterized protein GGS22DRAFT_75016 [Annulohypoxylon maeteangense]KAI0881052.1 hypothetical protein GGS22DRAFT_75016 [Annulohypoxylon maeteangense]